MDNLHLKSGIRPDMLAELHGNMTKLRCRRCERTFDRTAGQGRCECGGPLLPRAVKRLKGLMGRYE